MTKNKSANRKLTGRDELNLIDYPLSMFSKHLPIIEEDDSKENIKEIFITDPKTKRLKQGYIKIASNLKSKNGALIAGDEDVLIALMEVTSESGFKSQRVEFPSQNLLFSKIGWGRYGDNYLRLLDAFRRLRSLTIETNVFYDKNLRTYGHKVFGLLDEAYIATEADKQALDKKGDGKKLPGGYFVWNATIWESFKSGNIKYLDTELYRKIKNPGARKLFRILDKRFYNRNEVDLPLRYLASNLLNLESKHGEWYHKKFIEKYSNELLKHGYLKDYSFVNKNKITYAVFTVNREVYTQEDLFIDKEIDSTEAIDDISAEVYEKLIVLGFSEAVTKEMMLSYEINTINNWVDCLNGDFIKGVESKTGYLIKALQKNFGLPASYVKYMEANISREKQKQREEARRNCKICKGEGGWTEEVTIDDRTYTSWKMCDCQKGVTL